ncbi:N-acetylglucosaminyldiphosphodolichol N-acetylglucosaminyltransferase [Ranunculus cassubicifolius]
MEDLCITITLIFITTVLFAIRVGYVVCYKRIPIYYKLSKQSVRTLIVLGSGGHTAEMLNVVSVLGKERFNPRIYVAGLSDRMSLEKARGLESELWNQKDVEKVLETAQFMRIYRSREVGQSYLTSIGTTLIAILHALWLVIKIRPQVILCNGPGTCIPICIVGFFLKVVGIRWSTIFYIESIARVRRLSLSGLLLYKLHIADQIYVQWPQLQQKYPQTCYVGCLM